MDASNSLKDVDYVFFMKKKNNCHFGKKTVSFNIRPCNIDLQAQGSTLGYMKADFGCSTQANRLVQIAQIKQTLCYLVILNLQTRRGF